MFMSSELLHVSSRSQVLSMLQSECMYLVSMSCRSKLEQLPDAYLEKVVLQVYNV